MIDTNRKYDKMRKDEYEHLISTFFDSKNRRFKKKNLIIYVGAVIFLLLIIFAGDLFFSREQYFAKSIYISPDKLPLVIAYDFNVLGRSKIRSVSFDLENSDISKYKKLSFLIRTEKGTGSDTSIRVQIENGLKEKDSMFISGLNSKWKEYSFPLIEFKQINDWRSVKSLTFFVEEWNVANKEDTLYIDEVRFFE